MSVRKKSVHSLCTQRRVRNSVLNARQPKMMNTGITFEDLSQFARSGFCIWPGALSQDECDRLLAELSNRIVEVAREHLSGERKERSFWRILAQSAFSTDVFFDESGAPLLELPAERWESRAMRIGHALHLTLAGYKSLCTRPEFVYAFRACVDAAVRLSKGAIAEEAARLAWSEPDEAQIVQSAVIYKQPMSDVVQFGFHRDAAYLPNEPESLVLAFVALDETTHENGCLAVIPGTHTEPLGLRFVLGPEGFVTKGREPRVAEQGAVFLPLPRGSIAFVHGRTQHASAPNRSTGPRRALIVHAMSRLSHLTDEAWVREPSEGFVAL
ncbi:MAG: phytanoyl-CoA dioxygenase family protein [Polyangiaceae bacterium]|nr:phytanoyl-CoA dioxygenase family protein [Polyangiaceae bacterium]